MSLCDVMHNPEYISEGLRVGKDKKIKSLAPVVQMMDSGIRRINHYPLSIDFASVYPLDSDLSGG